MADVFSIIFYVSLVPATFFGIKAIISKINKNDATTHLKKLNLILWITAFSLIGYNIVTAEEISEIFTIIFYILLIPTSFFTFRAINCKINKIDATPDLKKLAVSFLITVFALIGYNLT